MPSITLTGRSTPEQDAQLTQQQEMCQKIVQATESSLLPTDWEHTYSSAVRNGSLLPALFLACIKASFPRHFLRLTEIVGERLWERKQPVFKGAHLCACSREAGLRFRDAEEVISRLPHVDSRQLLHENCLEALQLGASWAPFFVVVSGERTETFDALHNFNKFVMNCQRVSHIQP